MGKKIVLLFCLLSVLFLQSCSKSIDPRDLIAKDPLAVVYLKSMKDFEDTLSPQMMMVAGMAKGALAGMDDTKPVVLVLTGLEPVSAYVVVPLKDAGDKDSFLGSMSDTMKNGAEMKGNNLLMPIAGNLPSSFEAYDKLQSNSIIHAIADVDQIEKKHGKYIRAQMMEGIQSIDALALGSEEDKIFNELGEFYTEFLSSYMKESNYFNIEYRKSKHPTITGLWNFKKGSKMAEAANRLGKRTLPEITELKSMPVYYSSTMSWEDIEPMFGGSVDNVSKFYKALGIDLDFKELVKEFKDVGRVDMVLGMNMDLMNNNMDMKGVFRGENNSVLKNMVYSMLSKMAEAKDNELMKISKKENKFRGNDIYSYDEIGTSINTGAVAAPTPQMNSVIAADDTGAYYGVDEKGLEEVAKYKMKRSSDKGYFLMSMDYSKIMPPTPGMPPMNFILKMFATGGEDSFLFKLTFE